MARLLAADWEGESIETPFGIVEAAMASSLADRSLPTKGRSS